MTLLMQSGNITRSAPERERQGCASVARNTSKNSSGLRERLAELCIAVLKRSTHDVDIIYCAEVSLLASFGDISLTTRDRNQRDKLPAR